MADACRDDDDIAGPDRQHPPAGAAEAHFGLATGDPQRLVGDAVEMGKRVNAVAPGSPPAVGGEPGLEGRGRVGAANVDRTRIDQERQPVVRNRAVVLEADRLDLNFAFRCRHRWSSSLRISRRR